MDALMFFIFASQMLHIFGKVTVLRGSLLSTKPDKIKLRCLSEDDGGALVWNYNLIWHYYEPVKNNLQFRDIIAFNNNTAINCKMNENVSCLEEWTKHDWYLTNSLKTPMGPVFDQRWEEFEEYKNLKDTYDHVNIELTTEVKLSFSVRVAHDAHILICNGTNYNKDSCYWIIIGGWFNTESIIRKCVTGVPLPGNFPAIGSKCREPLVSFKHDPLSESEWRTFVVTWNSMTQRIIIYDTDKIIMTYTDEEESSSDNYHMFIRSPSAMLLRFHIYNFLHTTIKNAILTSPIFQISNRTMCIQLLIGLCAECEADLVLLDFTNNNVFVTVTAKGSKAIHSLPMWQSVKIKLNSSAIDYNADSKMIIQLIPRLNKHSSNPLWAIANVRQCPQDEALREGFIISQEDWKYQVNDYFWPNETCQKLFYDEHATVNHLSRVKFDVNLDDIDTYCPEGKIGPQCLYSCTHHLSSNFDCKGVKLCYEDGCTCALGFLGDSCSESCNKHTYGHGCMKTCGSCLYNEECNKANGECNEGCNNNNEKVYISPLCQTSIDKPDEPTIISISETTIHAIIPIIWKDEYDKIPILYSFYIRTHLENIEQPWKILFQNMTQLIGSFEDLEPGVTYYISLFLDIAGIKMHSGWKVVETKCNPVENFNITPKENSITINWLINPTQLYSCPTNWYYLTVSKIDTSTIVKTLVPTSFEYELEYLPSYTSFEVIIYHKNDKLFSQEIRTLEGIPSKVLDLQSMLSANTELILIWRAPLEPNGNIEKYEVSLKVEEYFGCKNLKISAPINHTITNSITNVPTITIQDLHPYRSYSAQVRAYNSRHFSTYAKTTFKTAQSEIPSEVFSQLTIQDWILSWSVPEDCTTISGPLKSRIKIQGISDAVKYFNTTKQTSFYYIDLKGLDQKLNGLEQYKATVYVIREFVSKENASAYQTFEFETPPIAPPRVTNLEVVEFDIQKEIIYLRWQSPLPPLNGKLRNYGVQLCDTYYKKRCSDIQVQFNEFCDLWDDYICRAIHKPLIFNQIIKVFAYNINVTEPGLPVVVTRDMLHNTTPDAPGNYTFTINNNSVIDLKWLHPWRTGAPLKSFRIRIVEISSNLRRRLSRSLMDKILEYPVTQYMRNYNKQLYLFPSTQYVIYIQAVTIENTSSDTKFVQVRTPSTAAFDSVLNVANKFDSTILLNIPFVINDTQDSMMYIIVKGHNLCEQYLDVPEKLRARVGIKMNEIAWVAAEASTSEFAGKQFKVGDNYIYGNAKNCPLKSERYYDIMIIVTERNLFTESIMLTRSVFIGEISSQHHEAWIVPVILLLVAASVAFYFYRRKKQKLTEQLMQDEMILSQNIQNFGHEIKSAISNSKQDLSISSNRQSLSRTTTPEIPIATANNNDEKAEMSSSVKVKNFEDYVKQAIQLGLLDKQYETFPRGQTRSWDYGKLPQNKSKNRYGNLIAYDETRVILKKLPDDAHSDYINANYITGYKKDKHYIATQGPKPNTVIDFWRMIWQENVLIICMLANVIENGKTKCEQYWPDIGKKKKYGDIIVLNAKHNVFADYCFRTFTVTCGEETRKIEHLHYTAWPDHGVPLYTHSVVTYLKKLLATPPGNGPVIVHCSAGVGRTGTIILCDICLRRAAAEGLVDVFAETASIRSERANMVDNKQQYLLAHLALVECLLSIPTTLPCNEMLLTQIKALKKQLPLQLQRLQNIAWQDDALRQITSPPQLLECNRAKNRFPELISDKISRIYLKRYPASDEDSDYLSAVYVDGVKVQNQYLATQLPMPSTINDFWRMIAEFKVELILMLQQPDFQDSTCCAIASASGEFKPVPYLNIIMKEVVESEYYTSQKLLLIDNSEKPSREQFVTILCLMEWKPGKDQPPPPVITMVTLWQAAERIARSDGPTVTLCHDGVNGCGLYLALSFLLERMAVERECDVSLAVRAVRRSRPDFVHSLEQLEYLYDAAETYLKYFETYANFS